MASALWTAAIEKGIPRCISAATFVHQKVTLLRYRPNIILLVADDLDVDSAYVLWETQKKIKELGVDMT